jgi:hypothetical protein
MFVLEGVTTLVSCEVMSFNEMNLETLCKIEQQAQYVGANIKSANDLSTTLDEQSMSLKLSLQSSLEIGDVSITIKVLEEPSAVPSSEPSPKPTISSKPTGPTSAPTRSPTRLPSSQPSLSNNPTVHPSTIPSVSSDPSSGPSLKPSNYPSAFPSMFQSQFDGEECRFDIECSSKQCDSNKSICIPGVSDISKLTIIILE